MLAQVNTERGDKQYSNSGYILKVEMTGFADGLDIEFKIEIKWDHPESEWDQRIDAWSEPCKLNIKMLERLEGIRKGD